MSLSCLQEWDNYSKFIEIHLQTLQKILFFYSGIYPYSTNSPVRHNQDVVCLSFSQQGQHCQPLWQVAIQHHVESFTTSNRYVLLRHGRTQMKPLESWRLRRWMTTWWLMCNLFQQSCGWAKRRQENWFDDTQIHRPNGIQTASALKKHPPKKSMLIGGDVVQEAMPRIRLLLPWNAVYKNQSNRDGINPCNYDVYKCFLL